MLARLQPGKKIKMAHAYSKKQKVYQQMLVVVNTYMQLSTNILLLCMQRKLMLKYIVNLMISKENVIRKQLLLRKCKRKTRKKEKGLVSEMSN